MRLKKINQTILLTFLLMSLLLLQGVVSVNAQSPEEIKRKIEERNKKIVELEKEIQEQEENLRVVGEEKQTLESAIQTLDLSRKKISTDISLTENKISNTDYQINELGSEIKNTETKITSNRNAIAETIRTIYEVETQSLIETLLSHDNLSEAWNQVETLEKFQLVIRDSVTELNQLKKELEAKSREQKEKKSELSGYKNELSGKKQALDQNRSEKKHLLKVTESEEAGYQRLLKEKQEAREQFERELQDLEAQLKFTLDPSSIPISGQGILGWPLSNMHITQYFGNTAFAKSGAYSGSGHNGIDLRASQGTAVRASLGGVVVEAGNTDSVAGCYSYGKWILVKHNNGLSTLYAHLSVINVNKGQTVNTGEVIGFSGSTGYSTGPHLHYSVYLSDAVQVVRLGDVKKITNCGPARIPIAPFEAYLNPLDYLSEANLLR